MPAYLERRTFVTVRDRDGEEIKYIGDVMASHTKTEVKTGDLYAEVYGNGAARVSVGLGEKIGGPYGYSSVDVRVNVTLTCNQDEETLTRAAHLAFRECVSVTDDIIDKSMTMLKHHLERNYEDGRAR